MAIRLCASAKLAKARGSITRTSGETGGAGLPKIGSGCRHHLASRLQSAPNWSPPFVRLQSTLRWYRQAIHHRIRRHRTRSRVRSVSSPPPLPQAATTTSRAPRCTVFWMLVMAQFGSKAHTLVASSTAPAGSSIPGHRGLQAACRESPLCAMWHSPMAQTTGTLGGGQATTSLWRTCQQSWPDVCIRWFQWHNVEPSLHGSDR